MTNSYTESERKSLLKCLGKGRHSAIGARKLAKMLNYPTGGNQVQLRTLIKKCIEKHHYLIGAATGRPAGFFIIENVNELETYLSSLEGRTKSDNTRRSALISNWNKKRKRKTLFKPFKIE